MRWSGGVARRDGDVACLDGGVELRRSAVGGRRSAVGGRRSAVAASREPSERARGGGGQRRRRSPRRRRRVPRRWRRAAAVAGRRSPVAGRRSPVAARRRRRRRSPDTRSAAADLERWRAFAGGGGGGSGGGTPPPPSFNHGGLRGSALRPSASPFFLQTACVRRARSGSCARATAAASRCVVDVLTDALVESQRAPAPVDAASCRAQHTIRARLTLLFAFAPSFFTRSHSSSQHRADVKRRTRKARTVRALTARLRALERRAGTTLTLPAIPCATAPPGTALFAGQSSEGSSTANLQPEASGRNVKSPPSAHVARRSRAFRELPDGRRRSDVDARDFRASGAPRRRRLLKGAPPSAPATATTTTAFRPCGLLHHPVSDQNGWY